MKPILTVTETAKQKIIEAVNKRGEHTRGIRIGVSTKGCSGHSYVLEFIDHEEPMSERVTLDSGVDIFVDPKSMLYVIGMEIDWQKEKLAEGFVFNNPNAKGTCGCGESFHV
jgi:iron-sulfur cluster assembly protein